MRVLGRSFFSLAVLAVIFIMIDIPVYSESITDNNDTLKTQGMDPFRSG